MICSRNFLTAGFYYKTFMWPKAFWEKLYEPIIRRAAGLGSVSREDDPDVYDKGFLHCDLLVIGAGPAGLSAADRPPGAPVCGSFWRMRISRLGGRLNAETFAINNMAGSDWAAQTVAELAAMDNVRLLPRTTVVGAFDHGIYGALERVRTTNLNRAGGSRVRPSGGFIPSGRCCAPARPSVPLPFRNNDRPGIMMAGAVRAYANRWAVTPHERSRFSPTMMTGTGLPRTCMAKGVQVAAVIDTRLMRPTSEVSKCFTGAQVVGSKGRLGLESVTVRTQQGFTSDIVCGALLAVSGGWNPNVHLTCHQRGRPQWDEALAAFVPGETLPVGMSGGQGPLQGQCPPMPLWKQALLALEALGDIARR